MASGTFAAPAGYRDSPTRPINHGEVVASTYVIRDEIGRTDTGIVFEARDMLLDRPVAFKLAWRDPGTPSLLAEARRCASVLDPCAVQVHGLGAHNGVEFVVGERVEGHLLRDELHKPYTETLYLSRLRTLVAAVARAHDGGIAVGDISGSTVLVAGDRLVLGRLSLSQVPAFGPHGRILAPEVVRGEAEASDPAAAEAIDLYGLGCIAVEMASGAPPFADGNPNIEMRGHANESPPRIADLRPDLPGELSDLVEWLLAKHPNARPRSVGDVLAQLDAVIDRLGHRTRQLRVLIVDDDLQRARQMWSLARRAHPAAVVETASEGTDAAHKLNRDLPDLVFVDAALKGVMNALELCMYARGLEGGSRSQMVLVGDVTDRDKALFAGASVQFIPNDGALSNAILERVRQAFAEQPTRVRKPRTTVSG
ncbi:MAG: serine/threonine-protein kinase [Kofleriaceae bacterium]